MKHFIFLSNGEGSVVGNFRRGDIREFDEERVARHIERGVLKDISKLSKDECRRFFFEMNINDLPDTIKVGDLQELLILTKEAIKKGLDLPEKISLDKIKKLLKAGDNPEEEAPEITEEVK